MSDQSDEQELKRTLAELNDPSSPNSPLFKALLQQSTQVNPNVMSSRFGPMAQMLSTYMGMQGNPNMQGSMMYNKMLGQNIGQGIEQPNIGLPGLNVTDLMRG